MAMFLFTTPPAREATPSSPVVDAIRQGAERTGTGFDYLLATAQRESALDPGARARSSSASGLYQFIEQTWLGLVKAEGPKLGLNQHANAIATRSDGTHVVPDAAARQAILNLREDPRVASVMAGVFTQRNRDVLAADLAREPSAGDLYVAHFLGARGAAQLIQTAQQSPSRPVASDFPDAAAANRSIFYDRNGRARGAGEVYALLAANHGAVAQGTAAPAATAAPAFAPDRPLAFAQSDGPAFHGLFQTDTRRGPVSDAVARLWRRSDEAKAGAVTPAPGFFPKSNPSAVPDVVVTPAVPAATSAVRADLPASQPVAPDPGPAAAKAVAQRATPLDLGRFMKRRKI